MSKGKKPSKIERLEEARNAFKWWEAEELPTGVNWRSLEHAGVVFAPPYIKHNIPLLYDGNPVELNAEQEEIATFYAAMPMDGPQLGNPKSKPVFEKNFFEGFQEVLPSGHTIKKFSKCDFTLIRNHLDLAKTLKKAANSEEKLEKKKQKDQSTLRHGYALIDGRMEKVGNYNMEPPGLFRGRGDHPKTGTLKKRCYSEAVSLNLSENVCPPIARLPGHAWRSVQSDPAVTWLCSWTENVQDSNKYVMLAASSSFKGKSDMLKYQKAIDLKGCIHKVRKDYTSKIRSSDKEERQLGTAMWVIDQLALRVGGEKGEDEADTVGCCSLRKEHLSFNADASTFEIELEFLGKDSMQYKQTINFASPQYGELGRQVYHCLKSFCAGKGADDDVFESLTPTVLNKHLTSLMRGLSAKVFRTFNASFTLEKELPSVDDLKGLTVQDKVVRYNAANRQVAILCNHQKTVSKAAEAMFEGLNEKLEELRRQHKELIKWKDLAKKGKTVPVLSETSDEGDAADEALRVAAERKDAAVTVQEKQDAVVAFELAKANKKLLQKKRFDSKHMFKSEPTESLIVARIEKWADAIRKLEVDINNRDENKEVALGTSKINYMDPRISVAWCKRNEVPIEKVFARTLRDKFNWAMAVPPDWKFE